MTFQTFNLDPRVYSGVQALGYIVPTPIQLQAIPPVMTGRDVMGLAQTGTGKTAAFVLPILQRLLNGPRGQVRALIIAPTRELAEQIHDNIEVLGKQTGLRSITIYGGVSKNPQIQAIRRGVEIVVACPGRLLDHINSGNISLANVEVLVLDEADNMFDMGFLPDIRRILKHVPAKRQTLLFSATMPSDIRHLAEETLRDAVTVQVGTTTPVAAVSHALYPVPEHLKTALLMALLDHTNTESVLIFTRTKYRAKRIGEQLQKAGYSIASLQGNLSQNRRQEALDGFREGKYQILVATDIAARGIDVTSISHVINYDMPDTAEAYTHRIGRTGRAAKTGDAFTLVTGADDVMVRTIERVLGAKVERRKVQGFDYGVQAPPRNTEFARPPREPQRRRPQPAREPVGTYASAPSQGAPRQYEQRSEQPRPSQPAQRNSAPPNGQRQDMGGRTASPGQAGRPDDSRGPRRRRQGGGNRSVA